MEPPEGSGIGPDKVLRLNKTLYGLKQSPRCFNNKLDKWLRSQDLVPSIADPCLYIRRHGEDVLLLSVHVDDQLIAGNSRTTLDEFKAKLNKEFECTDGGEANYFLGMNIHRDRAAKKLFISQEHYLESLLERFEMANCNPTKTPLPSGFKPVGATNEEHDAAKHLPYTELVSSIQYAATISRPDLAHASSVLGSYNAKWSEAHFKAAKHLLRYIRGTTDLLLAFDGESVERLAVGYVDAAWGADLDSRTSRTGYIFKVYGGIIGWRSRRQKTVALSTMEAEYMAAAEAAKHAIWLRQLLEDLGLGLGDQPLPLWNDNASAIALSKNPTSHDKSKHIAMRHHFIREKVLDNTVSLSHVPSAENLADMLTKSLPAESFGRLLDLLGVRRRPVQGGVSER